MNQRIGYKIFRCHTTLQQIQVVTVKYKPVWNDQQMLTHKQITVKQVSSYFKIKHQADKIIIIVLDS